MADFTLTTGSDTVTGTAGNDTVNGSEATLNAGDSLRGIVESSSRYLAECTRTFAGSSLILSTRDD
jgi:hypothetical protein